MHTHVPHTHSFKASIDWPARCYLRPVYDHCRIAAAGFDSACDNNQCTSCVCCQFGGLPLDGSHADRLSAERQLSDVHAVHWPASIPAPLSGPAALQSVLEELRQCPAGHVHAIEARRCSSAGGGGSVKTHCDRSAHAEAVETIVRRTPLINMHAHA